MTASFVPFAPGPASPGQPSSASFQLTVLPQATEAVPFVPTSLTPGSTHLCAKPSTGSQAEGGSVEGAPEGPEVTYEREGDRVSRIRIRCSCGQVVELNLSY